MRKKGVKSKENEILKKKVDKDFLISVDDIFKLNFKFKNKVQKELYDKILANRIVFVKGVAGTGKTFVSLLAALSCIKESEYGINKIVLTKIITPASKDIGYLKGNLKEKTEPYFISFYDNLYKIIGSKSTEILKESEIIEEKLVNFVRGSTFGTYDSKGNPIGNICILDEAQNTTINELKTYISRLGEKSKLIILGDADQVDIKLPNNQKNGLEDAFNRFQGIDGIDFFEFSDDDIVRDKFLIEIMKRYKNNI
jgi:phosphate starvation-inducible PhoH-like protein